MTENNKNEDLKKNRFRVLRFIYDRKRTSSVDIENELKIEKTDVREIISYLEQKKLIISSIKTVDGTIHVIKITAEGIDEIEKQTEEKHVSTGSKEDFIDLTSKTDFLRNKLESIEEKIDSINNRKNRIMNYNTTILSLLIATFLSIAFTSFMEFLKRIFDPKYAGFINSLYYFITLFSIVVLVILFDKIQSTLKIKEYFLTADFEVNNSSKHKMAVEFRTKIAELIKVRKVDFEFNGFLEGVWYKIELWSKTKGEKLEIKEKTAFEFDDKVKKVKYTFYNDNENEIDKTTFIINFVNNTITLKHKKGVKYDTALVIKDMIKKLGIKYNLRNINDEGY